MSRLRPFFKYYGSKYRIAPLYPAPRYRTIVEPFAGSASYSVLHADHRVVLIETDPEVFELWRWLIHGATAADVRALPVCGSGPGDLPPGFDLRHVDGPPGALLLMRYWQRVGRSRCWTVSKWGHLSGFWCAATRDRIAAQLEAIRHWCIFSGDLTARPGLTEQLGASGCTWFVDAPYQAQPKIWGAAPDFPALGRWVCSLVGQVIVCEAPGATWLPFRPFTNALNGPAGNGDGRKQRPELIWTNAP